MNSNLPLISLPIVRYYVVRCHAEFAIPGLPSHHFLIIFGQTPYNQLLLIHLTDIHANHRIPLREWTRWQEIIPINNFVITYENLTQHSDQTETEILTLTAEEAIRPADMDYSGALIDTFEIVSLFLIGAFQPALNLLDFLLETDLPTVIPLREIFQRTLSEHLKTNILGESQLLTDSVFPEDFIPISLIWFLGKTHMAGIDHYLQSQIKEGQEEEPDPDRPEWIPSDFLNNSADDPFPHYDHTHTSLSEAEKKIKSRFENELRQFYFHADSFFTRLHEPQRSLKEPEQLSPGTTLSILLEEVGEPSEIKIAVQTKDHQTIGYLKKELADILVENIHKGYHYSVLVAVYLPDHYDTDDRIYLLIRRHGFLLN